MSLNQVKECSHQETLPSQEHKLNIGDYVAVLTENDSATPFWMAKVVALPEQNPSGSKQIGVRWFQASGSASDPYDAMYIPSVRKREKNGVVTYWETSVRSSQIIHVLKELTRENRIGGKDASAIKDILYQ